ncbi:MAG: dihydroorotate dehydrogenase [Firmicutes bacterium]|nr:dihydroorotate dehydrogenase [Bacillota bacterium]
MIDNNLKEPNLKINIAGVEFKNPIITASGCYGFGKEYNELYDINLLGGISTKGLTLEPRQGNVGVRVAETNMGMLNCVGLQNPGAEGFIKDEMPFLEKLNTVIIANCAGKTEEDYVALLEKIETTKVDMIELNISCPNVKTGMAFGVLPSEVERMTRLAKKATKKPLMIKLTPNVANIIDNAKAAEQGGADAISLVNTLLGLSIDLKTRRPILGNNFGGLSGPAIKPVALRMVAQCFKAVKIPIVGMGGIQSTQDVLEFMIAGARAVQIGTANFYDPFICKTIANELTTYLKNSKIEDINEIVGTLVYN